jgi:hypothetical protein
MTNALKQQTSPAGTPPSCCNPVALFGWSPPLRPADTALKRRVDGMLPSSGLPLIIFFAAVIALLNVGILLSARLDLAAVGLAAAAAGSWCSMHYWRTRHAHCVITGAGWLALAAFSFVEAGLGRSLIHGDEGLGFLAVLAAGLVFEAAWYALHGTNAVASGPTAVRAQRDPRALIDGRRPRLVLGRRHRATGHAGDAPRDRTGRRLGDSPANAVAQEGQRPR